MTSPRTAAQFQALYHATPPWEIGRPQPAFARLATAGALHGRVLDVGCGTGEHALMAASLGLDATGVDITPLAIMLARAKARTRDLVARFVVADALDLSLLGRRFDTVLDCGLFHLLDDDGRARYVRSVGSALRTGGRFFVLCFRVGQPGTLGPRRIAADEISAAFADGWGVDSIEATRILTTAGPHGALAWRAALTRR